jgi:UDP-2-acetamido-3-amino-2,3-dideoxy-glucuronate N-acetyltransferase
VKLGHFNVIDDPNGIADDVQIGNFCVIEDDVVIGKGTIIRNYVELRRGTRIGEGCYIDSGVKISGDAVVEDEVTLRYDTIIARGCHIGRRTYVSPQTMFQNLSHTKEPIGGARIGPDCFIGTNVTFDAGIEVAEGTVIGSKSFVSKSIHEGGWIYLGIPAKRHKRVNG